MDRIGRLSSVVVWVLAVVVAWLERQAEAERETTAVRTDTSAADGGGPTRPIERPAPAPVAQQPAEQSAAPHAPQAAAPPATDEEAGAEAAAPPDQPEPAAFVAAPPDQAAPPPEPTAADQATAASEDVPASAVPSPPPAAASDVLAVAGGDLVAGAAEHRHSRSVPGDGTRECPPDYPIKGNADSRIYHRPGDSSYAATIAELCFASAEDAEAEGFRPRKR